MSVEELLKKAEGKEPIGDVTAVGVAETALHLATGLVGAFEGTLLGTYAAIRHGDIDEYAPVFDAVSEEVNNVVMYEPRTSGGTAAVEGLQRLWTEYISEPIDEHLVDPNVVNNNPLIAAIGKASGEGLPMFVGMRAAPKLGKKKKTPSAKRKINLARRTEQRVKSKDAAAQEKMVDVKTGEPVNIPAPISDRGVSLSAFAKFVHAPKIGPHDGIGAILKPLFYKPVQVIRDWNSPTMAKIADAIYHPTKADAKVRARRPIDMVDAMSKAQGALGKAWDRIIEPHKGRLNTVKKADGEIITRGLRTGVVPAKYRKTVLQAREFLDVMLERYIHRVLPDVGKIENFVPQVWNVPYILKNSQGFRRFLERDLGYSAQAAENAMRRIIESDGSPEFIDTGSRLVNAAEAPAWMGRIRQKGGASKASLEQQRKIDIPNEKLPSAEPFLINNVGDLMSTYIRNATKRVEYARRFGPKEETLNAAVAKSIKELGIENNPRAIERLTSDVYSVADAMQGKYKPIQSIAGARWNRRISNYETVLHLGLVSLASFPELAAPAIQFGFVPKAYAKGFAHAIVEATAAAERVLRGKRSIPKLKAAEALESMGAISLSPLQSFQAARFTSISSHFTSRFMHMTGLELLTDAQRVIAYETLSTILKRNASYLEKSGQGKKAAFYKNQLKELNIDPAQAVQWAKEGMPKAGRLADLMENAKLKGQRWAVTMPNPATRPLLFSDPHWTNVLLFKSFTGVFSNLFMKRAVAELFDKKTLTSRQASMVGSMVAATTIAYYTQFLREMISGYDTNMDGFERWLAAFDRAALPGPFTYAYQLVNPYRYGFTDSSAKRLFNLMGPAINDFAKVTDAFINPDISDKKRAETLAKMVPIANITGPGKEATTEIIEEVLP